MTGEEQQPTLHSAANQYLASLLANESGACQQQINKFVRWLGREKLFGSVTAAEIDTYAEQLPVSDTGYEKKFAILKAFLAYGKKNGWSKTNLANHLKPKKTKAKIKTPKVTTVESIPMTRQGYDDLVAEIEKLKEERHEVIEETRRAAADKDFRENAPLHAAREKRGHLEGRLNELESTLRVAMVMDGNEGRGVRAGIGDTIVLETADPTKEMRYTLVGSREVDVVKGKISSESPIGKALLGKKQGDNVEINAPVGKLRYKIKRVER